MEWKLFKGNSSEFTTKEWYAEREAAHHLEQSQHTERLYAARDLIKEAVLLGGTSVVDLGCGDGGLLSLLKEENIKSWGYDLAPKNIEYANKIRNVDARYTDFKNENIEYANIAVLTEVLEHLDTPHDVLKNLPSKFLIASSPYNENWKHHYEFHIWAWDFDGYKKMIENAGYTVIKHFAVSGWSQIVFGYRK